jgi:CHASE2 domain-containing sensor protein
MPDGALMADWGYYLILAAWALILLLIAWRKR